MEVSFGVTRVSIERLGGVCGGIRGKGVYFGIENRN